MFRRTFCGLVILLMVFSCGQQASNSGLQEIEVTTPILKSNSGVSIEFGPNVGGMHTDDQGAKHFYVSSTATITNDSIVPIQIRFELSNEYEFPGFCDDDTYKVFLLPEYLTPDTAAIYNNIVFPDHEFLNSPLDSAHAMNRKLAPGEFCVMTYGVLISQPANCAAVPRAVFSHDTRELYEACDGLVNQALSSDPELEIRVKLEYYYKRKFSGPDDGCVVIPVGRISYPED